MSISGRKMMTGLIALAALSVGGCAYDDYGYGGASVGYGSGGYYDDGFGYGGSPGYGYAGYGWYNDFYYPGTGYYVFDRGGRRHAWSPSQRDYWQARNRDRRQDREVRRQVQNAFGGRPIDDTRLRRGQRERGATLTPEQRTQRQGERTVRREQRGNPATLTPDQRTERRAERFERREQRGVAGSVAGANSGFRQRSQAQAQSQMRSGGMSSAPRAAPSSSNRGIAGTVARRVRPD